MSIIISSSSSSSRVTVGVVAGAHLLQRPLRVVVVVACSSNISYD